MTDNAKPSSDYGLLPFRIEKRGRTYVVTWGENDSGGCRPASDVEIYLWNTRQTHAITREELERVRTILYSFDAHGIRGIKEISFLSEALAILNKALEKT